VIERLVQLLIEEHRKARFGEGLYDALLQQLALVIVEFHQRDPATQR